MNELQSARADLLRGEIVFASGLGSDAPPLLLKAAKRLEPLDAGLARETYLTAWMAALFAGRLAGAGDLLEVSRAVRAIPASADPPHPADLVLAGLAMVVTDGLTAAAPTLRRALRAFNDADMTRAEELRWGWFAQAAASALWDDDAWRAMLARQVRLAQEVGALDQLPIMLGALGTAVAWTGDFAAATALDAEAGAVCEVTGSRAAPFTAMILASLRGRQAEAAPLIEGTIAEATAGGQGIAVAYAHWAAAILANGLGHHADALAAAREASEDTSTLYISMWALPELIEAAARTGDTGLAGDALTRLAEFTLAAGTDFGLGVEARSRALLSAGETAGNLYREAIERLGRTRLRPGAGPRAPALRRVAAPREPPHRSPRTAADRARHAGRHGRRGVRRTCPARAAGHRRERAPADGRARQHAHRAGGTHCQARRRRTHQPGDRRPAVPVRPHRRMASAEGVHQARHQLPAAAPAGPGRSASAVAAQRIMFTPDY